jgi:hypothetical protein
VIRGEQPALDAGRRPVVVIMCGVIVVVSGMTRFGLGHGSDRSLKKYVPENLGV